MSDIAGGEQASADPAALADLAKRQTAKISYLHAVLSQRDRLAKAHAERLEAQVASLTSERERLIVEHERTTLLLQDLEGRLAAMLRSTRRKLTAPIRRMLGSWRARRYPSQQ